jgi:hypothetical protein
MHPEGSVRAAMEVYRHGIHYETEAAEFPLAETLQFVVAVTMCNCLQPQMSSCIKLLGV